MLEELIAVLVPFLVSEAEKVLGSQGQAPDWVHGLVDEVFSLFQKAIPGWLKPEEDELKKLVSDAVDKLLSINK